MAHAWKLTIRLIFPFLLLFLCGVEAQEKGGDELPVELPKKNKENEQVAKGMPKANDAIALALKDISQFNELDRFRFRYIWVWDGDKDAGRAISRVLNMLSDSTLIQRPVPLGAGPLLLFRVDIAQYAPTEADFVRFDNTWEELRFDPRFNLLLTKQTIEFAVKALNGQEPPMMRRQRQGRKVIEEQIHFSDIKDTKLLRIVPDHVDGRLLGELQITVGSTAPIVTHDYFIARSMASIKDAKLFDGLYSFIYGGLYYDFANVPQNTKGATDLDKLLEDLGVGDTKNKVKADQVFDRLRSDKRVACFRSKVAAGRPRRIDFLPTLYGSVFDSKRFVAITHDLKRANIDIGSDPIMNLLTLTTKADAHEVIWTKRNGTLGYSLYNTDEVLQEKAPDDVVDDYTVPAPYYRELQAPISCLACHESEFAHSGWQPVVNDVQKLLSKFGRGDVVLDLTKRDQLDAFDRIAGLYSGNAEALLREARSDHEQAILKATGPFPQSADQTDVVKLSANRIVKIWRSYFYDPITPKIALRELGWDVSTEEAGKIMLEGLAGADPNAQVVPGVALDDPRIAALRIGIPISRMQWDLIYGFVAARLQKKIQENPKLIKGANQ